MTRGAKNVGRAPRRVYETDPLWDETLVVRGGLMGLPGLRESLDTGLFEEGFFNLSFWGDNDLRALDDVTRVAPIPNGKVRVSTVGELRRLGLEPYRTDPWPHLTVRFPDIPTDEDLEALVGAFGDAISNPYPYDAVMSSR